MMASWRLVSCILILFLLQDVLCSSRCPENCDCLGAIVDCSGKKFIEIPELPEWVEELNLSENPEIIIRNDSLVDSLKLKSLSLDDLRLTELPDLGTLWGLRKLSLAGNFLESLSSSWLDRFPSLHEIDLSGNDVLLFDPAQFQHQNLRKIDLRNNGMRNVSASSPFSLPSLTELRLLRNKLADEAFKNLSSLFSHMPSLKTIDLNRNNLKELRGLMFQPLSNLSLKALKLRRNNIVQLPDGVFYGLQSITTLQLDNNKNITEISNGWLFGLESLKTLTLSHNNIGTIKRNAWDTTNELTVLDISYNELGCGHREPIFKGLRKLQELFISHNCLSNLDGDTFALLSKLKILDISYNQLQWSVEDSTGAFKNLANLVSLNLAYNKIETIHNNVFDPLISLNTLDLSGNSLKTLSQNPFIGLRYLSKLYFNTSSLVCDCHLVWLPKWLATQSFNEVKATCDYPTQMKGASIFNLKAKDFSCEVSPQPVITTSPANHTVLYGQNMTLKCVALTGGDEPVFIWMKDRVIEEPFRVQTFMSVEEERGGGGDGDGGRDVTANPVYKVTSQLTVNNITHDHGGMYQCIARNSYGPSYSPSARIVVHRFPHFTTKPKSVEVREGNVAELNCAASGYPTPEISWKKEGEEFHAAGERRLHYMAVDNAYFIKPVLPRDDGNYVCTAKNEAGAVNISARISVIQTPNFSRPVQYNQAAMTGQSIVLECQGTGHPKPKVTWHKGGEKVVQNKDRVLLDDGQFLLLLKVAEADAGAYLCELTNTIGTQRRKLILNVEEEYLLPTTGIVIITVALTIVGTSIIWVLIIYKAWKRTRNDSYSENGSSSSSSGGGGGGGGGVNHVYSSHLSVNNLNPRHKEVDGPNLTPLLSTSHAIDGYTTQVGQDSGSEHSSGKDSGVGDSAHRSNEDLHRNGDVRSNGQRSLLVYPDASNPVRNKGSRSSASAPPDHSTSSAAAAAAAAAAEEARPKLSTFGLQQQHLDPNRGNSPIYASLRRGSTSRLLPVPSPVTPAALPGSLPRSGYRSHHSMTPKPHALINSSRTLPRCRTPPIFPDDGGDLPTYSREAPEAAFNFYSDPHSSSSSFGGSNRSSTKSRRNSSSLKQQQQQQQQHHKESAYIFPPR